MIGGETICAENSGDYFNANLVPIPRATGGISRALYDEVESRGALATYAGRSPSSWGPARHTTFALPSAPGCARAF